jgi:hypothetical protein
MNRLLIVFGLALFVLSLTLLFAALLLGTAL